MDEREIIETGGQIEQARPIEVITAEIQILKQRAGEDIIGIGQRLIEAKSRLAHGEWLPWLENEVQFSEASAQRFMRLAKAYSNPSALTDLGPSKALILLGLPESEREEFVSEKHEVNGEEKSVAEMTSRELDQAIRELKKVRKELEDAEKDLYDAEEEKDRFAEAVASLEEQVADYRQQVRILESENEAQAETAQDAIAELNAKIQALEAEPKEVTATETIVDHEAEEKLKAEIAALKAEMAEKQETSKRLIRQAAEKKNKADEEKEAALKAERAAAQERELALQAKLEDLQKQLRASSAGVQVFKVHFQQAQEIVAKMLAAVADVETAGSEEDAAKLKRACVAYADHVQEAFAAWR